MFSSHTSELQKKPTLAEIVDQPDQHAQRTLATHLHNSRAAALHRVDTDKRTRHFRLSLLLPHAKEWLKCQPSPGMHTHIHDIAFRMWFTFFARSPIQPGRKCPRRGCQHSLDTFGDHLLVCKHGTHHNLAPRIRRHDQLVRVLHGLLVKAQRTPVIEPRDRQSSTHSRPDIRALGISGGEDLLDVAVTHPLYNTQMNNLPTNELREQASNKRRQHSNYAKLIHGAVVRPIVFAVTGGWLPESAEYVDNLAKSISRANNAGHAQTTSITFQQFAATLITTNVRCLIENTSTMHGLNSPDPQFVPSLLAPSPAPITHGATRS